MMPVSVCEWFTTLVRAAVGRRAPLAAPLQLEAGKCQKRPLARQKGVGHQRKRRPKASAPPFRRSKKGARVCEACGQPCAALRRGRVLSRVCKRRRTCALAVGGGGSPLTLQASTLSVLSLLLFCSLSLSLSPSLPLFSRHHVFVNSGSLHLVLAHVPAEYPSS